MRLFSAAPATIVVVIASGWLVTAGHSGSLPPGNYSPGIELPSQAITEQEDVRLRALKHASLRIPSGWSSPRERDITAAARAAGSPIPCRFVNDHPGGTSPKFNCVLDGGAVVKVKYGRNPEIYAEAAATRLLTTFGYAADTVEMVPALRCYGCPRDPFLTMRLFSLVSANPLQSAHGYENRYTDFSWVAIERKFPAPAVESKGHKGWAWWELSEVSAPRADIDALRLLAIFLAHWDNKEDNQRLVCLDDVGEAPIAGCDNSLALIQDLGSTFGPIKMNLTRWRALRVWSDVRTCTVSMKSLPFNGATFPDSRISEEGRVQLARQLSTLNDDIVRQMFLAARFQDYYSGTDDERDLEAWMAAFRDRVDQIVHAGPCPSEP